MHKTKGNPMTNLLINLTLLLSTNWTGATFQDRELGYVVTNHVLEVQYRGVTNKFTVQIDLSDKAVWRQAQILFATNYYAPIPFGMDVTAEMRP